jgi:hypothetical protein
MPPAPLLRWDGLHLVIGLETLQVHLDRLVRRSDRITDLSLEGREDMVRVHATVAWKGISSRASLDLTEIRLRHRYLGFRMSRLSVLGGLRIPRRAIEAAIRAVDPEAIRVCSGDGIIVVDLRSKLPAELDLSVLTVQATERALHVWFGAGGITDVPGRRRAALPAGVVAES